MKTTTIKDEAMKEARTRLKNIRRIKREKTFERVINRMKVNLENKQ